MSASASGTVVFNVGGRHFEVLRHTVEAQPETLLACLLDDVGTTPGEPVFVDANPDRFAHILDWYRYREMYLPEGSALLAAVLRDARFFLLPDRVVVNGEAWDLDPERAKDVKGPPSYDGTMLAVAARWERFEEYVASVEAQAEEAIARAVEASRQTEGVYCLYNYRKPEDLEKLDAGITVSIGTFETAPTWSDPANVCSMARVQALIHRLRKDGYKCDVRRNEFDIDLRVSLPCRYDAQTSRVVLGGVDTHNGRLCVATQ